MSVAAFIGSQRTEHGVPHAVACRALGVSESWFYKWHNRRPTPRQVRRAELADKIREFFDASGGTYGSPRITLDLWAAGYQVSENTVAKLMAGLGLAGRQPRRRPRHLTRQGKRAAAPDLVQRKFTAVAPDVLWCGDLTEIDTDEGKLYLATVLDLFSRRLLGYAMSEHHDAAVARASLQMAVATRGDVDGVIFHSMNAALTASMTQLPEQLRKTLTWDRGKELSAHAQFAFETGTKVFFADPHSPWQRPTNENTNGLLRQYFPKGTDLSRWTADDLEAVALALNNRPRKILGWRTPAEVFAEQLRSIQQAGVATTG